jgi:hypothetical protein
MRPQSSTWLTSSTATTTPRLSAELSDSQAPGGGPGPPSRA